MNEFQKFCAANGGTTFKVNRWKTLPYTAKPGDESSGLTVGANYVVWFAQTEFTTKSGNQYKPGDYIATPVK